MSLTAADINELSRQHDELNAFLYRSPEQKREAEKNDRAKLANMFIEAILDNARQMKRI